MKIFANCNRTEREFQVGQWVFLQLQPYRQTSLAMLRNLKLSPKFYGPYQILEKIGKVAYKLDLPVESQIHLVFHVSLLKKKFDDFISPTSDLPPVNPMGHFMVAPMAILDCRMVKRNNQADVQLLVHWENMPASEATWEDYDSFVHHFPLGYC